MKVRICYLVVNSFGRKSFSSKRAEYWIYIRNKTGKNIALTLCKRDLQTWHTCLKGQSRMFCPQSSFVANATFSLKRRVWQKFESLLDANIRTSLGVINSVWFLLTIANQYGFIKNNGNSYECLWSVRIERGAKFPSEHLKNLSPVLTNSFDSQVFLNHLIVWAIL